jgi:hypothetical protein
MTSQILDIYAYTNLSKETPFWAMDTPEKVIEAADGCEFEKNALWHRRSVLSVRCVDPSRLLCTGLRCLCETTATVLGVKQDASGAEVEKDNDTAAESTSMMCDGCLRGIVPDYCALCRYCFDVGFCPDCFVLLKELSR